MNELDIYYRALLDYHAATRENRACDRLCQAIARANAPQDRLTVIRNICTVEEDWIEAIEAGLVHIEKAIKEERQFIYSDGEVLEIEKVRHFSPESVRHLAKHSNLITREQEDEGDISPDKLYSVERHNDYAVYENRFLYMLLCYLRDFITLRYDRILELSNTYTATLELDKRIELSKQKMSFTLRLHDERRDDPFLRAHNTAQPALDRIDLMLKTVTAFLATPLMEIAGKAPMLKPPITKTNVLKMDHHFKGAVALYDFIVSYDRPGYTVLTQQAEHSPFSQELGAEMSDAVALMSFLAYEQGLELRPLLKESYAQEQTRRKEAELLQLEQQAQLLKRRLADGQATAEEYIAVLEARNKLLEGQIDQLRPLRTQLGQLTDTNAHLHLALDAARAEAKALSGRLEGVEEEFSGRLEETKAQYDERIHDLMLSHESEIQALEQQTYERLGQLTAQMDEAINGLREQLRETNEQLATSQALAQERLDQYEALAAEHALCSAQLKALRLERGDSLDGPDYTQQEQFGQLEQEFEAFYRFYQTNWRMAKRSIRSRLLNYKYLKGLGGE